MRQHLATKHGIVLQQPAYSRYYLQLGEISSYPPGLQGKCRHLLPQQSLGDDRRGDGRQRRPRATTTISRINPSAREDISDVHRCEPYVYAQMIAGRDAPTHGEAKNSWLTGTAAWNYYAITQWILGIRTGYDGLLVAPDARGMERIQSHAQVPRCNLWHCGGADWGWQQCIARSGWRGRRGQCRSVADSGHKKSRGEGDFQ